MPLRARTSDATRPTRSIEEIGAAVDSGGWMSNNSVSMYSAKLEAPAGRLRDTQKGRTRAAILRTARELFADRGVAATSTAAIAAKAGISHGAVFVHFKTRDDLLLAVIEELGAQLAAELSAGEGTPNTLRAVIDGHLRAIERREALYARLVAEAPVMPAAARAALAAIQNGVSWRMQAAAARERELGRLRTIPPHLLFNTWIALVHHYLVNRDLFAPGRSVVRAKGRELADHYVSLVTRESERRQR